MLARAVRTTQAAADRAFAKVVASGMLRRDGGTATTPSFSQEYCDAMLLAYLETAAWREANMKLIPVWYRIQWTGRRMDELLMHALLAQGRRERELGEKCYDDDDSDSDLSEGPQVWEAQDVDVPGHAARVWRAGGLARRGERNGRRWWP